MGGAFHFTQTVNQGPCQVAQMLHLGVPRFSLQLSFCLAEKVFVISKVFLHPCLCSRSHCSETDPIFSLTAAHKALVLTSLYAILGMGSCTNSGLGWPPLWPELKQTHL